MIIKFNYLVKSFLIYVGIFYYSNARADVFFMIQKALETHPGLRAQQNNLNAASAGLAAARWQFWPTPSLSIEKADTQRADPSYKGANLVSTARLQQPLWTGGRLSSSLSKAQAQELLAQADWEGARQQLALRVIQTFSEVLSAQRKIDAYVESQRTHLRLLALVERRVPNGASARADVDLARSRLDSVEADLMAAQTQQESALDRMRLLTGIQELALPNKNPVLPPLNFNLLPKDWLDLARQISPQMTKAQAQIRIAEADVGIARAAWSPEVVLRLERQWGNFTIADVPAQNRAFISLSSSLGAGLATSSAVDAAQARLLAAQEDYQSQNLSTIESVLGDVTLAQSIAKRRQSLERASQAATDITISWERQFLAGRKQWQELMNAAREQAQAEAQLADAQGAQQLTAWRLFVLTYGVDALVAVPASTAKK